MVDARGKSELHTTNMAYNMVVELLHTFRRRLSVRDALRFVNVLPPAISAPFVSDWDSNEPQLKLGNIEKAYTQLS